MQLRVLCGDDIRESIYNLLKKPLTRVRILSLNIHEVYLTDGTILGKMLERLLSADVRVTIVVGEYPKDEKVISFFKRLIEWGARIYYNSRVHAKTVLAEGENVETIIMSANITPTGLHGKYEIGVHFPISGINYDKIRDYVTGIIGSPQTRGMEYVVG